MRHLFSKIAIALCMTLAAGAVVSAVLPSAAVAKPKAAKASIDDSLGDLKWGMDHEKVMQLVADKINADYRAKVKGSTDESYADMMRKSYTERIDNMRNSYLQLMKDNVSNLSVSIVGEEFMPDNAESMLTQRDDIATKYFFFYNDKLYKMAIVYDSNYIGPIAFDTFCATTASKYGDTDDEIWDDDYNFVESIWSSKTSRLSVKNKYASYGTFLMVFTEAETGKALVDKHKAYYKSVNSGPEISSDIDLLTMDDDEDTSNTVDSILGKSTKIDLLAGLSEEDRAIAEGKYTVEEAEKQKKAKAKKNKDKRKKNEAKAKAGLEIF